jgi:hypothetical protein
MARKLVVYSFVSKKNNPSQMKFSETNANYIESDQLSNHFEQQRLQVLLTRNTMATEQALANKSEPITQEIRRCSIQSGLSRREYQV